MVPSVQKKKNHKPLLPLLYTAQLTPDNLPPPSPAPEVSPIPSIPLPLPTASSYPTIYLSFIHLTALMPQLIVPPMPAHGECGALWFNPAKLHELHHFFNDLNFQFTQSQVVDEMEMKGHALWFVSCDTAELWEIVPKFTNMTTPYQTSVDAVYQLYPGSDVEQHWLDNLVGETLRTGISSLTDLEEYYRDFIAITTFLILRNHLTAPRQHCAFTHGFPPELWSKVSYPNFPITSLMTHTLWNRSTMPH